MKIPARYFAVVPGLAALAFACAAAPGQEQPVTPALIQKSWQANVQEFFDLLALPNDSINAEDVQGNADWLEIAFGKRGFDTKQLANSGKPLVFAEYKHHVPGAKTILFYMHFDGQPVVSEQWTQKSPWIAALKARSAGGKWDEIDRDKLKGDKVDLDWRLFARSASDDNGPIMMFLTAFDALAAAGLAPAMNVKVLLDGEEEKDSPHIGDVATANHDTLRADAIVINDGPLHESNAPDDRLRQSRQRPSAAHRLRAEDEPAQRPLRQLRAEPGATACGAARQHEGRRWPCHRERLLRRRQAERC